MFCAGRYPVGRPFIDPCDSWLFCGIGGRLEGTGGEPEGEEGCDLEFFRLLDVLDLLIVLARPAPSSWIGGGCVHSFGFTGHPGGAFPSAAST